jgi:phosphoglycerate-specific signal transduction histidine kinase
MPSFKPKTNKKIKFNKKTSITLDTKHKEFLNEFSKDENCNIPALKIERQLLKERKEIEKDSLTIEQLLDINDNINKINEKIKEIKMKKKEYFLDNSKCIFEYFENKKNISIGNTTSNNEISNKNKILNSFFKITPENVNIEKN